MSELNDLIIRSDTNEKEAVHAMKSETEVRLMLQLRGRGVSTYAIARVLACSRNTVYRYLRQGGWQSSKSRRTRLTGHESWLAERFERHGGNADVIRQELRTERDIEVSLRTVERAVQPLRRRRRARQLATRRFETPPGDQLQVDFGQMPVTVDGRRTTVHLFVATLGYSRRQFVAAFENQSQRSWLDGMERAFRHFGGVPRTVLMDNPKALVTRPRGPGHGPTFNERLLAFAAYWRFQPRACHPYRARTKGQVERSVGYVKHNALAGRRFAGWGGSRPPSATLAADGGRCPAHANPGRIPRPTLRMGTRTPDPGGSTTPVRYPGRPDSHRVPGLCRGVGHQLPLGAVAPRGRVGEVERHRRAGPSVSRIGVGGESCTLHRPPSTPS